MLISLKRLCSSKFSIKEVALFISFVTKPRCPRLVFSKASAIITVGKTEEPNNVNMKWNDNSKWNLYVIHKNLPQTLPIKCEINELIDQYKLLNELNTHAKCNWNYVQRSKM